MLNERSCFMHSVVLGGWAPETEQFPCFIVVASHRGLHIGTRGRGSSYPHPHKTQSEHPVCSAACCPSPGGSGQILREARVGVCQLANWWHVTITAVWAVSRDVTFVTTTSQERRGRYDAWVTVTRRKLREIRDSRMMGRALFSWTERDSDKHHKLWSAMLNDAESMEPVGPL